MVEREQEKEEEKRRRMKRAAKRKKDALSGTSSSASAETFTETQLLDIAPAVSLPHPALPLIASGRSGKNGPTNPLHTVAIERVEARQPRSAPYTMYIYIYIHKHIVTILPCLATVPFTPSSSPSPPVQFSFSRCACSPWPRDCLVLL